MIYFISLNYNCGNLFRIHPSNINAYYIYYLSFPIILLIIIKIILISLERSLLLGTLMHYHAYIEGSCVRLSSHWTVPPFLIQSLLTPIFVHLLFQISFLSPIGMFRKSCVIRSCLLLTVYYHSFILLSTILYNIFIFSFFKCFSFKLYIHFIKFEQSLTFLFHS